MRRRPDDPPNTAAPAATLDDLIRRRCTRRALLGGGCGVLAAGLLPDGIGRVLANAPDATRFRFTEIARGVDRTHHVAPGYRAAVLIRWGDPVLAGAAAFDPHAQSATAQRRQFGYNNDFIGYVPLHAGAQGSAHGLLCVNHEYTVESLMFPATTADTDWHPGARGRRIDTEMAAHGGSILEVRRVAGRWRVVDASRYARRISALDTPIRLSGPAAGHPRLRTAADPRGTRVIGTLANCAGGITPWGTYLMAEENFDDYFVGELQHGAEAANHARYGIPGERFAWGRRHARFDLAQTPKEANRFGWIVEVDPLDPTSTPVKRTALGRFKHEGAECVLNGDGRVVLYSGDDEAFEYLYRFVSAGAVDRSDRRANRDLLDRGTLYVARFNADGSLDWLPLVHGRGPLTAEQGFASQADVLIETRRAADLLGATPMDRPEDVEPDPVNGRVYLMLTGNPQRTPAQVDAANPRATNRWGHVLELIPPGGDHAADHARWEILVRAGDPADPAVGASWNPATGADGWFACPDNAAIDPQGRLWVCSDQGGAWSRLGRTADGVWALETQGAGRGTGRLFYRAPVGAEVCGPRFTPDGRTLFVAVQHPGKDGTRQFAGFERRSTFDDPATRWPDFDDRMPPRPAVVAITRDDLGVIGD